MGWPITKPSTIYAIRCKESGRVYIGRTYRLEARIREHFTNLRREQKNYRSGIEVSSFLKDYIRYGEDSFFVYILEENVLPEMCKEREAFWIAEYHATNPKYGYNKLDEQDKYISYKFKQGLPPNRYKYEHAGREKNKAKQSAEPAGSEGTTGESGKFDH